MNENDREQLRAMSMAAEEIRSLRKQVDVLGAIADTVKIFGAALLGRPDRIGMGEDAEWMLRREIDKLEKRSASHD